jgi:HD-GYP domain-containing protein (c-di-GMP phosphodiesterase class II)
VAQIVSTSGTQFDPRVVHAFTELHNVGALDLLVAGLPLTSTSSDARHSAAV